MRSDAIIRAYVREVLTGYNAPNALGSERAVGNLGYGTTLTARRNKGILDDVEEEETLARQELPIPVSSTVGNE